MESINELINELGDSSRRIRQRVERELVKLGEPAVEPLIEALKNENRRARWRAANALGKIKDTRAIKPLIHSFGDDNVYVKVRVAEALGKPTVESFL